jgi:hypothetical protein
MARQIGGSALLTSDILSVVDDDRIVQEPTPT